MTQPRTQLISLSDTPYYHIVSRCVRRSFLCGVDHYSGNCYEHRRGWIEDRLRLLSSLFSIDICAYAVMSNHYHLVLKAVPSQLEHASADDIINRWCSLFKGPLLIQRYRKGEVLSEPERDTISDIVAVWQKRLCDISWFMRCLNQPIARQANLEDGCTGRFWESRFKSQALRTEEALLSCMAYVDLNPIRAGMADRPEESDYTSIKERISPKVNLEDAIKQHVDEEQHHPLPFPIKPLLHFDDATRNEEQSGIPFTWSAYLELVDWTGRAVREEKRGAIPIHLPPILLRLNISEKRWLSSCTQFEALHHQRFNRKPALKNTA